MAASARLHKFQWGANEVFEAEIWMLSDLPRMLPSGEIQIELVFAGQRIPVLQWTYPTIDGNTNLKGPAVRYVLPDLPTDRFVLRLMAGEYSSEYTLSYKPLLSEVEANQATNESADHKN